MESLIQHIVVNFLQPCLYLDNFGSANTAVEYRQWCHKIGAPIGNSSSTVGTGGQ